jgi:hypothetical protein
MSSAANLSTPEIAQVHLTQAITIGSNSAPIFLDISDKHLLHQQTHETATSLLPPTIA